MSRKASLGLEHINLPWKPGPDKEVLCHIALHGVMQNIKLEGAKPNLETQLQGSSNTTMLVIK